MKEIDWSKAPEGATHFGVDDPENMWFACWHKKIDGEWYGWLANQPDQWDRTVFDGSRRRRARVMSFIEKPALADQKTEQDAAEERAAAVGEMIDMFRLAQDKQELLRAICFTLHDAGYRKQEQPE